LKKMDARDISASALTAFRKRNAWQDGYLRNKIRENNLSTRDAALATEIVNGVLQNMMLIDYYISHYSSVKFNKISPGILDILRMAIYQILFLDKIPDSAAVNDAVKRAKRNNPRVAGFVNALTRKISAEKDKLPEVSGDADEVLSVRYSHPLWLVRELVSFYGREDAEKILRENNSRARMCARVNTLKLSEDELVCRNEGFEKGVIENSILIKGAGSLVENEDFKAGNFYIQDAASQIAAQTLSVTPGSKVLDACAAPGGKSFFMAQCMENTGEITSCDIYEHKLELIKDGAKRLGVKIIRTKLSDASVFVPEFEAAFDYVMADVPCSGIGIIRKKPDIRYKDELELRGLPALQIKILENVSRYVKRGGYILYSTCTILPRENSEIVSEFLKRNSDFEEVQEYTDIRHIKNQCGITLLPHLGGTDGFYMCKLRRKK